MAILCRLLQILWVLMQHGLAHYAGVLIRNVPLLQRRLPPTNLSTPERLKAVLESMKGSYIKLGQMLALQPDLLGYETCHALYSLLDHVSPVGADEIEAVFRQEIGKAPGDVFDNFERRPIASGSIGQVHLATLNGKKLAVKIQRPDTQESFERDVKIMTAVAWVIERLHLRFLAFMVDPLREFAEWTIEELNFASEARFTGQLRRNASGNAYERIPAIVPEFTSRRVLVLEFLEGVTLLDHIRRCESSDPVHAQRMIEEGFDCDKFAKNIIDNFLNSAFIWGIFHADQHPANIFVLRNNVVGYIDFGITGIISPFSRRKLIEITLAYARRQPDVLCERFFDVSSLGDTSDPEGFRAGIRRLSEKWYKGDEDNPSLKTTTTMVMLDMLRLSRATRIWPQRDVIKYIRSAIAIDGLIRQFAPHFDVGHHLALACSRHLAWHARKALCSHDALINWSHATVDLVQQGAFRLSSAMERIAETRRTPTTASRNQQRNRAWRAKLFQLAVVAGVVTLIATTTNGSFAIGFNLFTAQVIVVGFALATIWRVWPEGR